MRQIRKLAAGVVACLPLLIPLPVSAAGWLVGAAADGTIYDVDIVTGMAGNPRSTGIEDLLGITFAGDDTLYGLSSNGALYTIDLTTGAATDTGTRIGSYTRHELAWDPIMEALYYLTTAPGASGISLTMFNLVTEEETYIGGFRTGTTSIAFDNTGVLFAIDNDEELLLTVDNTPRPPDDRYLEFLAQTPLSVDLGWARGLAVVATDTFYVSALDDELDLLYALEPTTGLLTLLGPTGAPGGLNGLTVVPEPASLLLLGMGGALMLRRAHRKSRAPA
ncbi:MAG: PEP-CTERM sorting domain-containing protein [Planctomycetes bacterium]|nr:PEP-CTERM sorting domain-containing protein [Planctomycetota bacterium]